MTTDNKALAIIPRSVDEIRTLAAHFAKSALMPEAFRGKEYDVFAAIASGLELGLPPMASLRGINIIKGKPSLMAATMVAVVLGRGLAEYFECVEDTPTSVTYETKRVGGKTPQRATWTIEDARRAGLSGDNWHKYPSDMLHARCQARLARRVYPDVLAGYYTPDEVEHSTPVPAPARTTERFDDASDAVFADRDEEPHGNGAEPSFEAQANACTTEDELKALAPKFNALPKGSPQRKAAHAAYTARMAQVRQQIPVVHS